jgi:hypothetical protein
MAFGNLFGRTQGTSGIAPGDSVGFYFINAPLVTLFPIVNNPSANPSGPIRIELRGLLSLRARLSLPYLVRFGNGIHLRGDLIK